MKRTVSPREESQEASHASSIGRDQSVSGQLAFSGSSECFLEESFALDRMREAGDFGCGVQAHPSVSRKTRGHSSLQQRRSREGAVQREHKVEHGVAFSSCPGGTRDYGVSLEWPRARGRRRHLLGFTGNCGHAVMS